MVARQSKSDIKIIKRNFNKCDHCVKKSNIDVALQKALPKLSRHNADDVARLLILSLLALFLRIRTNTCMEPCECCLFIFERVEEVQLGKSSCRCIGKRASKGGERQNMCIVGMPTIDSVLGVRQDRNNATNPQQIRVQANICKVGASTATCFDVGNHRRVF